MIYVNYWMIYVTTKGIKIPKLLIQIEEETAIQLNRR